MARTKGAKNKQTLDVKELAQDYTAKAIQRLAKIMDAADAPHAAQVAAARELLDRAHGKPKQAVDVDAKVEAQFGIVERRIVRPGNPDR